MNNYDYLTASEALDAIRGLSDAQRRAFDQCCINNGMGHNPRTMAALERKRLVVPHEVVLREPTGRWPVTVIDYEVPLPVHITWCEWCAEQLDEDEEPTP